MKNMENFNPDEVFGKRPESEDLDGETRIFESHQETVVLTDIEKTDKIKNCKDFYDLYEALEEIGEVKGSVDSYSPEKLKGIIENTRKDNAKKIQITNTYGIRAKVMELLGPQ